jgi:hypothetical protein
VEVQPYDQNIVTFEGMFDGYVDALRRFDAAARTSDAVGTFVPLFEALNWAVALDQRIAAHFVPDGRPAGLRWPSRIGYGAVIMPGVRFARNSVHHQWSEALELRGGTHFSEWVWRAADELPTPDQPPHPENERVYREQMEGRPARVCLDALGGAFLFLKELLEPFTMPRAPEGHAPKEDAYDVEADAVWPG